MSHYLQIKMYCDEQKAILEREDNVIFNFCLFPEKFPWDKEVLRARLPDNWKTHANNYLLLACATASTSIPEDRYRWLLAELAQSIQTYTDNLPWSLVAIAVTFDRLEHLVILIEKNYYAPTNEQLKDALFFAAFYGSKDCFHYLESRLTDLNLDTVLDSDGNSLLHVAVMENQADLVTYLLKKCINLEADNNEGYKPIHAGMLLGNVEQFKQIEAQYQLLEIPLNYRELVNWLLEKTEVSSDVEIYSYLFQQYCDNEISEIPAHERIEDVWMKKVIDQGLDKLIPMLLSKFSYDINGLIAYADSKNMNSIKPILYREKQAKKVTNDACTEWITAIKSHIKNQLERYVIAYINKDEARLQEIAREDRVEQLKGSHRLKIDESNLEDKKALAHEALENFFFSYYQDLVNIYKELSAELKSPSLFIENMILKRAALFVKIKNDKTRDVTGFENELWLILEQAKQQLITEKASSEDDDRKQAADTTGELDDISVQEPDISLENSITDDECKGFISTFVEEFDKTYRFFLCLSEGDLVEQIDVNTENFINTVKNLAKGILPDISLSPTMIGIPIPLSVTFPTGLAVAGIIDVCLYMHQQNKMRQTREFANYFKAKSLRRRTDMIYECAESCARRYRDQITVLSSSKNGVHYFAEVAVLRIFTYMLRRNTLEHKPSYFIRVYNRVTGKPEPIVSKKILREIVNEALSEEKTSLFQFFDYFKDSDPEKIELMLADPYERQDKQWYPKYLFEQTGRRARNGITYKKKTVEDRSIETFGYINVDEDTEITHKMERCNLHPWFEPERSSEKSEAVPVKATGTARIMQMFSQRNVQENKHGSCEATGKMAKKPSK